MVTKKWKGNIAKTCTTDIGSKYCVVFLCQCYQKNGIEGEEYWPESRQFGFCTCGNTEITDYDTVTNFFQVDRSLFGSIDEDDFCKRLTNERNHATLCIKPMLYVSRWWPNNVSWLINVRIYCVKKKKNETQFENIWNRVSSHELC